MANKTVPRSAMSGERPDIRAHWRHVAWGGAAVLALCAVAITVLSQPGSQRLALLMAPAELPIQPVKTVKVGPPAADGSEGLTAKLRELAADRDLLSDRVTSLERQIGEMTGSIKRLAARVAANEAIATNAQPSSAAALPAPIISPLAMPVLGNAAPWMPAQSPPDTVQSDTAAMGTATAEATGSIPTPTDEGQQQAAAPAFENVPLPPARIATAEPSKGEFGLALAGASSLKLTRIQWTMLQTNFAKLLAGLEPRVLAERRGTATHYRLLAGPLPTLTDAANLCARLIAAHTSCMPMKFGGDPL